jgi:hypothetical protein
VQQKSSLDHLVGAGEPRWPPLRKSLATSAKIMSNPCVMRFTLAFRVFGSTVSKGPFSSSHEH